MLRFILKSFFELESLIVSFFAVAPLVTLEVMLGELPLDSSTIELADEAMRAGIDTGVKRGMELMELIGLSD